MKKLVALFALALASYVLVLGYSIHQSLEKTRSDDPTVWEEDIAAFEAEDRLQPPPEDAILFVGSSSIRLWDNLEQDMAPLAVIKRGFGGSRVGDLAYYASRLITPYRARAIVIFIGVNDINVSDTPMEVVPVIEQGLRDILATIRSAQPGVDVFYVAISPSPVLETKYEAVRASNAAVAALMETDPRAHFIATSDLFLDEQGQAEKKLFRFDGLHLSVEGYQLWSARIKPLLKGL